MVHGDTVETWAVPWGLATAASPDAPLLPFSAAQSLTSTWLSRAPPSSLASADPSSPGLPLALTTGPGAALPGGVTCTLVMGPAEVVSGVPVWSDAAAEGAAGTSGGGGGGVGKFGAQLASTLLNRTTQMRQNFTSLLTQGKLAGAGAGAKGSARGPTTRRGFIVGPLVLVLGTSGGDLRLSVLPRVGDSPPLTLPYATAVHAVVTTDDGSGDGVGGGGGVGAGGAGVSGIVCVFLTLRTSMLASNWLPCLLLPYSCRHLPQPRHRVRLWPVRRWQQPVHCQRGPL